VLLVGSAGVFRWLGCEYAERLGRHSPHSRDLPTPSRTAQSNNKAAELRLPANLEGTAVAYPQEVAALADADGEFRTGLSLDEIASVLKVDPQSIAKRESRHEIDPDAFLFMAVTGRLTEQAKARSRRMRETDLQHLQPVSATSEDWVKTAVPFSLNSLRHPDQEQKIVLDAISRSARDLVREPGAKANAVPLLLGHERGELPRFEFAGGYLPLELPSVARGMDANLGPE
jgi:hypothetical protein